MGFAVRRAKGRARFLAVFTVLLVISSAVPVLADPSSGEVASGADAGSLLSAAEVAEGIAEAERNEAEEEELLETPAAEHEREESTLAYSDLSGAEAAELLRSEFSEQLAVIDQDPARALTEVELEQTVGATGAVVELEGDTMLVDGTMPVRVPEEDGDLRKVSLELEPTETGSFVAANPLVDLELPAEASRPMRIGETGLAIAPVVTPDASAARPFGEKDLLYPEALQATDLLATPISSGLELSALLRSEESPEELRFAVTLPPGGELQADGEGGAKVLRDGEPIASVRPPTAIDAQGADVPVSMQVQGTELLLSIEHRDMDLAYPALVDPIVDEWYGSLSWYAGYNLQGLTDGSWGVRSSDYGRFEFKTSPIHSTFEGSNRGLFLSAKPTTPETQWAYRSGAWVYTVPGGTSYISDAGVSPFWRHNDGCSVSQYPQPHDYIGLWSDDWSQYGWITFQADAAYAQKQAWTKAPSGWREKTAKQFHVGLGTGAYNTAAMPCWRDLYVGGAYIWMNDLERPTLSAVGAPTTAWVSDDKPFTMTASASDAGLGVKTFAIGPQGQDTFERPSTPSQCTGFSAKPCPASVSNAQISLDADRFGEGERTATISAKDPLGEVSDTYSFYTKVDRSPPEITLSGQLAEATKEEKGDSQDPEKWDELSLPVYKLTVKATDIGKETDAKHRKRSGVKDIEIWVDGVEKSVEWGPQTCPLGSCEMTKTYPLKLSELSTAGKHKLKVVAVDQVGKKLPREIEFEYIPATGMKDEYVMHYFPLPDGSGSEAEEEHPERPELAVNVMNGNLVYREQDIEVDGTAAPDLDVERYYNSMQPESADTEWGDGWTLAQTPDLELIDTGGSSAPDEANLLGLSGLLTGNLLLPTQPGAQIFDPALQATLLKRPSGGYELIDETGESATSVAFDETGQTEALLTEGLAKVDYSYEGGELAEIEVVDPSTFAADPGELQIPKSQLVTSPLYSSTFGSNGSGDGQLKSPADVAIDGAGNLFVVDRGNNRIQKFDSSGKFVSKFGAGLLEGQLNKPSAVALDSAGNIWVADTANHKIKKYNAGGAFIGGYGSQGTFFGGQFATGGPEGIATDANGNVWVSDTYGGRIQKFSSAGQFLKAAGSKGSGLGQLGEPAGLDVAPDGKIWVADRLNNRVAVFSEAGEFLFHFGVQGTGNGAFDRPEEVEIDAHGNVWVGDRNNHRVQQFSQGAVYVAQFGSYGTGEGKFSFGFPLGLATDSKGSLWVADVNNHRIQRWLVPIPKPTYASSFGANGSGDGQLKSPADVALGVEGNLWVADKANNRIQKFDPSGKFLAKYGSLGSGDGQLNAPSSIAVDRDGNILVADTGNNRIQKFDPSGKFLAKYGTLGSGNGQLSKPEEVLADAKGNIWVADTLNGRVQQFDEEGKFVKILDSGQLFEPTGIDISPAGSIWVADWQKDRLTVFNPAGEFTMNVGSTGSGNGQFNHPDAIEIDNKSNVWVGDTGNHRVQRFSLGGSYGAQFGSSGSGPGQFNLVSPMGIASDREGRLWVADSNNHRVQRWLTANYAPAQAPQLDLSDGDAAVEVETASDLVTAVNGIAAGEHTYEHEGDFLVSHDGPEGETSYEKDSAGRLSKVTLPNGNWAAIEYEATHGRVKKVSVSVGGADAKVTEFAYKDGPRSTTVIPPDAPAVTYDIGNNGSVFKWWHVAKPPEFLDISGTLWAERGTEVEPGDQTLKVVADSPHGVASIKFIANGNQIVDEKTCAQTEAPGIECEREENLWVTDTADYTPGILHLEAIVTNRLGESETERFWVNIPYTPPPTPGAPMPPRYKDILQFREDYGLEVVFPVANETELSERIFDLIGAWHNPHTPAGEVARATMDSWGVPLRPADVAEMEFRENYIRQAATAIPQWANANGFGAAYAGYYVDHRQGGLIYVGFTNAQAGLPEGLLAPGRIRHFSQQPTQTLSSLESLQLSIIEKGDVLPGAMLGGVQVDVQQNQVDVGASNVTEVENFVDSHFGVGAPVAVHYEPVTDRPSFARIKASPAGPVKSGEMLGSVLPWAPRNPGGVEWIAEECSVGWGAWDIGGTNPDGGNLYRHFITTAGHCFAPGEEVMQWESSEGKFLWERTLGNVRRYAFNKHPSNFATDAEAIRVEDPGIVPRLVRRPDDTFVRISGSTVVKEGMIVCRAGAYNPELKCGAAEWPPKCERWGELRENGDPVLCTIRTEIPIASGSSGGPYWERATGAAVGTLTGGIFTASWFTPVEEIPGYPKAQGSLQALGVEGEPLHLVQWK